MVYTTQNPVYPKGYVYYIPLTCDHVTMTVTCDITLNPNLKLK